MAETKPLDKERKKKEKKTARAIRPYFGTLRARQPGIITRTRPFEKTKNAPSLLPLLLYGSLLELLYLLIVALPTYTLEWPAGTMVSSSHRMYRTFWANLTFPASTLFG